MDKRVLLCLGAYADYMWWMISRAIFVILALLASSGPAIAACTDPAMPGVNWRRCYQDGRDLQGVALAGAELRDATFQRSDLDGANLSGADAYRAKFISASMVGVDLEGARLTGADLTRADLTDADLRGADLRTARLIGTILRGADLTGARLERADLSNADLSGAIWIDGDRICAEGSIGQCARNVPADSGQTADGQPVEG